jgi:hypothetical protein
LRKDEALRMHSRDLKDMYFQFKVPSERLPLQAIGPRVPLSWYDKLDDLTADDDLDVHAWCWKDLHLDQEAEAIEFDPDHFRQPAMGGIIMGDVNGVLIAQEAHKHLLRVKGPFNDDMALDSRIPWIGRKCLTSTSTTLASLLKSRSQI